MGEISTACCRMLSKAGRYRLMNKNFIIYLVSGILVMLTNYLIMKQLIKTKKQATVFMTVKILIIIGVAIYLFAFVPPNNTNFTILSGFILAMMATRPPKEKNQNNKTPGE